MGCVQVNPPRLSWSLNVSVIVEDGGEIWIDIPKAAFDGNTKFFKAKGVKISGLDRMNYTIEDIENGTIFRIHGVIDGWRESIVYFSGTKDMPKDPKVTDEPSVKRNLFNPYYNFSALNSTGSDATEDYSYATTIRMWSNHNITDVKIKLSSEVGLIEKATISNFYRQYGECSAGENTTSTNRTLEMPMYFDL